MGVWLFTWQLAALVTAMVDARAREQPCMRSSEDQPRRPWKVVPAGTAPGHKGCVQISLLSSRTFCCTLSTLVTAFDASAQECTSVKWFLKKHLDCCL